MPSHYGAPQCISEGSLPGLKLLTSLHGHHLLFVPGSRKLGFNRWTCRSCNEVSIMRWRSMSLYSIQSERLNLQRQLRVTTHSTNITQYIHSYITKKNHLTSMARIITARTVQIETFRHCLIDISSKLTELDGGLWEVDSFLSRLPTSKYRVS